MVSRSIIRCRLRRRLRRGGGVAMGGCLVAEFDEEEVIGPEVAKELAEEKYKNDIIHIGI